MSTGQDLVDRSRVTLIDDDEQTWLDAELLGYLNAGIAQACATVLDAYVRVEFEAMDPGVRQHLPAGGLVLIDIPRNGAGGVVLQQALTEFSRVQRNWPAATPGQPVYFMYDKRSPLTYLVSPPASSGTSVELVFGAMPDPITLAEESPIAAWYDTPLWAYVVGMALAKNTTRQDLTKSGAFLGMFTGALDRWHAIKEASVGPADIQGVH